jgi:hypothetical protein
VRDERRGEGTGAACTRIASRVLSFSTSVEVNRGDGDHVRRVEETELGAVRVVDDEPVRMGWGRALHHACFPLSFRGFFFWRCRGEEGLYVPGGMQRPFFQLQSSLTRAPVSRSVVDPDPDFARFGNDCVRCLPPAQSEEGAVWMEYD